MEGGMGNDDFKPIPFIFNDDDHERGDGGGFESG
jgi:hypothetical protein